MSNADILQGPSEWGFSDLPHGMVGEAGAERKIPDAPLILPADILQPGRLNKIQ
jgi:hypothetical protein